MVLLCICNSSKELSKFRCSACNNEQHASCVKSSSEMKRYTCPRCQIALLDPFVEIVKNILTPCIIKNSVNFKSFSIANVQPIIDEYMSQNASKNSKPLFISIRCLNLNSVGYEHQWPITGKLIINSRKTPNASDETSISVNINGLSSPIYFYFRDEDKQFNKNKFSEESLIKFCLNKHNRYRFQGQKNKALFNYVMSIDLVRIRTVEEVIGITERCTDIQHLINLRNHNSDGLEVCEEFINLNDTLLNSRRIKYPARSLDCSHLSVFDLELFLESSKMSKKYHCPLCKSKSVRYYIDGLIEKIISDYPHLSEVRLNNKYEILPDNGKAHSLLNKSNVKIVKPVESLIDYVNVREQDLRSAVIEVIDLDDEPGNFNINDSFTEYEVENISINNEESKARPNKISSSRIINGNNSNLIDEPSTMTKKKRKAEELLKHIRDSNKANIHNDEASSSPSDI